MKAIFSTILIALFITGTYGQSLKPEDIASIKEAVVYVKVKQKPMVLDEEITVTGTGFFISKNGNVITNYHVIQNLISGYGILFPTQIEEIKIIRKSGSTEYKTYKASIYSVDKEHDLAILSLKDSVTVPFLNINPSVKLIETMPVWVFGFPFGESFAVLQRGPELTITNGNLTSLRHDDRDKLDRIQVDASVNPGNSGGPVVNEKGEVIGIINIGGGTTRMNFAIPVSYVKDLLQNSPIERSNNSDSKISIKTNPPGAKIFIDWKEAGESPLNNVNVNTGWHAICAMKDGYRVCIKQPAIGNDETILLDLEPQKKNKLQFGTDVSSGGKPLKDEIRQQIFNNGKKDSPVLLEETFKNTAAFNTWKQNTGGTGKRTWFIEDGMLQQYENDGILHAISLGDSLWTNYVIKTKMKINGKEGDPRAGIIFRETNDGFYLFRIHAGGDKAQLAYHCKQPFGWNIISEKVIPFDVKTNTNYNLSIYASGNHLVCYLDSMVVFNEYNGFSSSGKIGFYSVESNPMFQDLSVGKVSDAVSDAAMEKNGQVSFWFSDHFNFESNWWKQYQSEPGNLSPWIVSDAGFVQPEKDNKIRYNEFTRYDLGNFSLALTLTFNESDPASVFEIYFRKSGNEYLSLRFTAENNAIELRHVKEGDKTKLLKSEKLPDGFFKKSHQITLQAKDNEITCATGSSKALIYSGKLPSAPGIMGFSCQNLPVILHELNVSSPREEKIK